MFKLMHRVAIVSIVTLVGLIASTVSRSSTTGSDAYAREVNRDEPVCYMQTPDGRTLNLDRFCRRAQIQPQVLLNQVSETGDYMSGQVTNYTGKTVHNVRVNYETRDETGTVIETGAISVDPQTLNPSQTARFEAFAIEGGTIKATSIDWDE